VALPPREITVAYNGYTEALTLDLRLDTLDRIAKKITQITKRNVILAPGINNRLITVYIENMPFDNALDKMALANNLRMTKTKDNFYYLEGFDDTPPLTKGGGNGGSVGNGRSNSLASRENPFQSNENLLLEIIEDSLGNKRINLNAFDVPIADVIKATAKEMGINYFMFTEPKGKTMTRVKNVTFDQLLTFLFQGSEHSFKKNNGIYLVGERALEGLRAHRVLQLQNRSAEIILDNVPPDLKKGVELKYFKELNSIIMSGSEWQIQEIETFIKQLDKAVPMILIEVILVNVTKTRTTQTGLTAGLGDSTVKTQGTILPSLGFTFSSSSINNLLSWLGGGNIFNLGRVTPNFFISLNASENIGNVEVTSTPKLSTLNGHEATLKIGQTQPYQLATQNTIGSLTTNVVRTVAYQTASANLTIKINPSVSGDDQVTLDIDVENTGFTSIPASGPPPTSTSAFKSIIRVRNEEMVVLGGLESLTKNQTGSGIPLLSRIPVLKWLFSNRTSIKNKSKQLVFVRPTIIY
jgi:type IV pilus assembly protein PilQ